MYRLVSILTVFVKDNTYYSLPDFPEQCKTRNELYVILSTCSIKAASLCLLFCVLLFFLCMSGSCDVTQPPPEQDTNTQQQMGLNLLSLDQVLWWPEHSWENSRKCPFDSLCKMLSTRVRYVANTKLASQVFYRSHTPRQQNVPQFLQGPHILCFDTKNISLVLLKCSSASVHRGNRDNVRSNWAFVSECRVNDISWLMRIRVPLWTVVQCETFTDLATSTLLLPPISGVFLPPQRRTRPMHTAGPLC